MLSKFQGCIIGKCVGDALGFIVEGGNEEYCTKYVKEIVEPLKMDKTLESRKFPFGQYSDDSQLARELMISLVENQGFIAEDYTTRIAKLFKNNEIVGGGLATSNAASRLIKGISWRESGEPSPYAGNGTAMRVAPLGLFYYNDLELLEKYAIEQGKITHKDMRCSAGSVIVALSVSYVLTHDTFDNYDLLDFLEQKIKPISELFSRELANLKNWIELPFDQAITRISQSGKPEMTSTFWNKILPYVIPTVLCSLYSFLCNKDNFMNTIATSIKVGGDVDTTSAISGAVSGAFLGIDAIPKIYSEIVIDQGKWGYSQLMSLAEQLYSKIN